MVHGTLYIVIEVIDIDAYYCLSIKTRKSQIYKHRKEF